MTDQISLLSYNTHLFEGTIVEVAKKQIYKDSERQSALTDQLKQGSYDVIGLTEVWASENQDVVMAQLDVTGRESFAFQDQPITTPLGPGLVLSVNGTLKPPPMGFAYYEGLIDSDNFSAKGVAYGQVTIGGKKVFVIQTHTQASYVGSEKEDQAVREKTMRATLYPIIDEALESFGGPIFLLGDLNIIAGSDEYIAFAKQMQGRGLIDAWTAFSKDPGYTYDPQANALVKYFDPKETQKQRLDYIFFREEKSKVKNMSVLKWKTPDNIDISDHYGVTAEFSL